MASVFHETRYGGQSSLRQDRQFRDCQVSKLNRNLPCIEQETEIGRRNPRCNRGRFFLNVVGDQPVVLFGAELGEVPPGVKGRTTKK